MFDIFLNLSSIKMAPISLPNEILTENYFFYQNGTYFITE